MRKLAVRRIVFGGKSRSRERGCRPTPGSGATLPSPPLSVTKTSRIGRPNRPEDCSPTWTHAHSRAAGGVGGSLRSRLSLSRASSTWCQQSHLGPTKASAGPLTDFPAQFPRWHSAANTRSPVFMRRTSSCEERLHARNAATSTAMSGGSSRMRPLGTMEVAILPFVSR